MSIHASRTSAGTGVRPRHAYLSQRTLLAAAIAMQLAMPAFAQQAGAQDDAGGGKKDEAVNLDTVEVRGVRASLIKSQVIKRDAAQIVDSVSAEDIGALPDRSVTETLQRVSGVTIDHFMARNDPDHFSAEGSGVMIRGMTQVRGELNGRDIFSANSGRGLSFEDVPAELMAGVDVYKNPSAEIIEGGLGGTVNLRTYKPFDFPGRKVAGTVDVNYGDMSKEKKPSGSFLFSDRWNTGIGEVGAMIDLAYSELATESDGIQVEPFYRFKRGDGQANTDAVLAGSGLDSVYVPGGVNWRRLDFERKRQGIAAAFQWRPNEDTEFYLQYLRSKYDMNWTEHASFFNDYTPDLRPATGTTYTYDANGVFVSGNPVSTSWRGEGGVTDGRLPESEAVKFVDDTRYATQKTVTQDISAGFKRYLTENDTVQFDAQLVQSKSDQLDFTVAQSIYLPSINFDLSGKYPQVDIANTDFTANRDNYYWFWAMDHLANNKGRELALRLDFEHQFDSAWLRTLRFGVRSTDRSQTNRSSAYNWQAISETWAAIPNADGTTSLAWLDQYMTDQSSLYNFSDFFNGKVSIPTNMWFPNVGMVKDYSGAAALIKPIVDARGSGWTPVQYLIGDVNRQHERTQAAYGVLYFGNDETRFPIDGNVGVRVVQTRGEADGWWQLPNVAGTSASEQWQQRYQGQYFENDGNNRYTDVLPSLNLRVKFTDSLQWRFAASKAIARPSFDDLKAYLRLAVTTDQETGEILTRTGDGSNPLLDPMRATQFDTALEWYFDDTDMLYVTAFYKDVKNYIAREVRTEVYDDAEWQVTRPYNMDNGKIKGVEFGYTQFFDSLPGWLSGFGVSGNYTYIDSEGSPLKLVTPVTKAPVDVMTTLPLEGLSKNSYNAALIYEKYRLSARLAYNWRSRYLLTTSDAATGLPTWSDDFGQLDASVFYGITKNIQIGLQANNLTDTVTKVLMGPSGYADGEIDKRLYTRGWFVNDRRYSLVLRANW
ncbi:TonB-dependent receptor [[Pseudomonas] boreopolis]|uniref:TonB-dependent receptor n=1 Tax=Xanthomonas boreopolis TaxID=86183 RepID=UPI003D9BBC14